MAVLGDSIAAATLADVPIPYAPTPEESVQKWHDRGVEPDAIFTNKRTLSWASGEKIRSHFVLLREWMASQGGGSSLEVANFARPGADTADLAGQVGRLLELLQGGRYSGLEYVAITIGSNDACGSKDASEIPQEKIQDQVTQALAALVKGLRGIATPGAPLRVLLVGVPRIPNLGAPAIRDAPTLFGLSCSTVRDRILKYCVPLTVWNGKREYLQRLEVVERINGILRGVAIQMSGEFKDLEVVYSDRLFQLEIPVGALAVDCFHPGKWAQEQVSLQTWKDQPWFH